MNKTDQTRLLRAIRKGELDETWVTLHSMKEPIFARRIQLGDPKAPDQIVIHHHTGLTVTRVSDIFKAVH